MPLFRHGRFEDDPWLWLDDDAPAPAVGMIVVSLARLRGEEGPALRDRDDWLGVRLQPGERVEGILPFLPRLGLVAFHFPSFSDGRAFSEARLLRDRYRFGGEIRATGHLFVDQYAFLVRCGFDAFDVPPDRVASWIPHTAAVPLAYQVDRHGDLLGIWRARHGRTPAPAPQPAGAD